MCDDENSCTKSTGICWASFHFRIWTCFVPPHASLEPKFYPLPHSKVAIAQEDSQWTLLTSAWLPAAHWATVFPAPDINNQEGKGNDFTRRLLTEINIFVHDHEEALEGLNISAWSWVFIDQKGLEIPMCPIQPVDTPHLSAASHDALGDGFASSQYQ
ncbi:hypothetical protein DFH08DRAFT_808541 [Mycena albidolilacea]|uniref:Uncharacterized protein n=1 Tax=Mycena albidolilacea TaxID=1033008 RepID=A0AAD7A1K0_9AGAR|nr:hypothetical protein DFH08DRAFT_808541 [Mycena albidolilacea]